MDNGAPREKDNKSPELMDFQILLNAVVSALNGNFARRCWNRRTLEKSLLRWFEKERVSSPELMDVWDIISCGNRGVVIKTRDR
jgi:hypothetical protein